MHNKVTLKEY